MPEHVFADSVPEGPPSLELCQRGTVDATGGQQLQPQVCGSGGART